MTDIDKLALCRVMVGQPNTADGWTDDVLNAYLNIAGKKIIARRYPYDDTITDVPARYGYLQCEIATYLLNKRGAEGEVAHSENGINRTYESADVPESMLQDITPVCGVI